MLLSTFKSISGHLRVDLTAQAHLKTPNLQVFAIFDHLPTLDTFCDRGKYELS